MFKVGTIVSIKVQNTHRTLYTTDPVVYESKVLKSESYDNANTVRLAGTNPYTKVHVIPLSKVIEVDGKPYSFKNQPAPKVYTVNGSKGAVYQVTITPTGNNKCTCSAFQFRGGNCKHIQAMLT